MTPKETAAKLASQPDGDCTALVSDREIKALANAFLAQTKVWPERPCYKTETEVRSRIQLLEKHQAAYIRRGGNVDDDIFQSFSFQICELRWVLGEMEESLMGTLLPKL